MTSDRIIHLVSVDSTNNYAKQLLDKNEVADGTVIFTEYQFSGRGQGMNSWESEPHKNLTFSIIYHPLFLAVEEQIALNKAMALAVAAFVSSIDKRLKVKIKWPNDIYIGDKKVAGILIENTISGNKLITSIAGIGININQAEFMSDAPNPTSMKIETGKHYDINNCLHAILKHIDKNIAILRQSNKDKINSDYIRKLYRFGEYHDYNYKGIILTAKMTGVTEFGRLILQTDYIKSLECDQKDVEFII